MPARTRLRLLVLLVVLALLTGCTRRAPAPPPPTPPRPDPPARITRPATPDELFGEPRPDLPDLVIQVLDGLWKRQLPVNRFEARVLIEELDETGNPLANTRPLPRYITWDARYGYRLFTSGAGFICDGVEHTDLSTHQREECPEAGFHAKVALVFEVDPFGASHLEALVRQEPTSVRAELTEYEGDRCIAVTIRFEGNDGGFEVRHLYAVAKDFAPIRSDYMDFSLQRGRAEPMVTAVSSGEQFEEVAPNLWVARRVRVEIQSPDLPGALPAAYRPQRWFSHTLELLNLNEPLSPSLFVTQATPTSEPP